MIRVEAYTCLKSTMDKWIDKRRLFMKKLIALILIIFVFALSGCGMSESASEAKLYGNNFILSFLVKFNFCFFSDSFKYSIAC